MGEGLSMFLIITTSILVGLLLAQRSVFILIPVIGFAAVIVAIHGVARGDSLWWTTVAMVVASTSIQIGYIAGIVLRLAVGAARATRGAMPTAASRSL